MARAGGERVCVPPAQQRREPPGARRHGLQGRWGAGRPGTDWDAGFEGLRVGGLGWLHLPPFTSHASSSSSLLSSLELSDTTIYEPSMRVTCLAQQRMRTLTDTAGYKRKISPNPSHIIFLTSGKYRQILVTLSAGTPYVATVL